ncbi:hypothetical protein EBU71_16850, partial [bacterium]|nr:hypothetical protein [Candidatus Elulimicrobium humile]
MSTHLLEFKKNVLDSVSSSFCAAKWFNASIHLGHGYTHSCHLPLNKIIYLTGAMNGQELYGQYCKRFNIPNDPHNRMHVIVYPSSQSGYAGQIMRGELTEPEYDAEHLPEKLFLAWNRRFRFHRTVMALGLDKLGLVDRSYFSFNLRDPEKIEAAFPAICNYQQLEYYGINREDAEAFSKKLPLVIDGEENINNMCEDRGQASRP